MLKIVYLHGLESNPNHPKNEWLHREFTVFDPAIDYREPGIYQRLFTEIQAFEPDALIGSSMGGFFAFHMARSLNIPALLFNPALHFRSYTPDMSGWKFALEQPFMQIGFGEQDDLIPWKSTLQWLREQPYTHFGFSMGGHGHQTPMDFFQQEVTQFTHQLLK